MTLHILATGTSRGIGEAIRSALAGPELRLMGHASRPGPDASSIPADLDEPGGDRRADAPTGAGGEDVDAVHGGAG